MANLIEYIQSQVYENSTEDISGSIMQQVLTRMASDEGVVNVHTITGQTPFADYNNAQAARDAVPAGFKKLGLIITYKLSSGWYIDEFIGSATSGWSTASNWKCLGPISVSQNASTGKTTITIGSQSFDVATQPVSVSQNTLTTENKAKAINVGGTDYNITDQDAQDKISQLGQPLNTFFIGENDIYVRKQIDGLAPGVKYHLTISNPNYDMSGVTVAAKRFQVVSIDANSIETILVEYYTNQSLPQSVEFTVPADSAYLEICGRATSGVKVWFMIENAQPFDYKEQIEDNRKCLLNNYFVGDNNSYSEQKVNGLKPNTAYIVTFQFKDWDMSGVTITGAYRMVIQNWYNGIATTLGYAAIGSSLADYYEIAIPSNSDYITVGGRATIGVNVFFNITPKIRYTNFCIIDSLGGRWENVVINTTVKTVTIKKQGLRVVALGKSFLISGENDFIMSYDSANHANGAWLLSLDAVEQVANGGTIELSPTNIYWDSVDGIKYRTDLILFSAYYGHLIATGALGEILLQRLLPDNIEKYAFNSVYNETDITEKCKEYSAMLNNSGEGEQLIFMTDPHLLGANNTFSEQLFKDYIGLLQKYYNMLPVDWLICGGDWLNDGDYQVNACWKLGYMDATMRKLFKHYYPMLGNHDTNYQGVVSADDSSRGDLTHQTLVNLMFRENGNTYYKFKGNNTQFYVFDTQLDWSTAMDTFKWAQIDWFANSLISDNAEHAVILQHIFYTSNTTVNPMAEHIQTIAGAYNSRSSVTLNGITYDFSGATGRIACVIAGHSHTDAIVTSGVSVPVWLTTNMTDGDTPTFDLCLIDYTANEMKAIRVGTGSNRTMQIA